MFDKERYFNKIFNKNKYRFSFYAGTISLIFTSLILFDSKLSLLITGLISLPLTFMVSKDFKRYYKLQENAGTHEEVELYNKMTEIFKNYALVSYIVTYITLIGSIFYVINMIQHAPDINVRGFIIIFSPWIVCFITLGIPQLVWYVYLFLNSDIRRKLKNMTK